MNITPVLRKSYVTRRLVQGAAGRYVNGQNPLHSRSIITLKDHIVGILFAHFTARRLS